METVLLKTGGRIEGELVNADDKWAPEVVLRMADGGLVTIPRNQVRESLPRREQELTYEKVAPTYPDTVEGQLALSDWCATNYLSVASKSHLRRILELSPDNEIARRRLGYQKYDGEWLTRDEINERKGLLNYRGKAMTKQDIELMEKRKLVEQKEKAWLGTMKRIRDDLDSRDADKQDNAKAKLLAIDDAYAVKALITYYDIENDKKRPDAKSHEIKLWYIETLGHLATPEAIAAIVKYSLEERDDDLRVNCFEIVGKHKALASTNRYIVALKDKDNEIVQRAALGLRYMGDRRAVAALIDSLITQHVYDIPTNNATGANSITSTFDKSGRGGGGGLGVNQKPQKIRKHILNEEVHTTLAQLTGQDFGFDDKMWRKWLATQKESPQFDGRRTK